MREDLSDGTDEDAGPALPPQPPKPPVSSFRLKNDSDLFGLGPVEAGRKEISDEGGLGAGGRVVGHGVRARTMLEGRAAGGTWPSICTGGIWWPGSRAVSRTDLESCRPREEFHGPEARGALTVLCRPRQLHSPRPLPCSLS